MPLHVLKGDLVSTKVDAIVNAANVNLKMVEGVSRAIFHNAGDKEMTLACKSIGHCNVGDAVTTPSFNITNTKMIIHAVAPIYINGKHREPFLLRQVYKKCLQIALDNNFESIAFPLLGGEFNWPLTDCYEIAVKTICEFLKEKDLNLDVYIVMYKNFPTTITDELHDALTLFITSNFNLKDSSKVENESSFYEVFNEYFKKSEISVKELAYNSNLKESVIEKILSDETYKPSKISILSLIIGMKLSEVDAKKLLASNGYFINKANIFDLIVLFFIERKEYDIYKINNVLFSYDFNYISDN